MKEREGN